MKQYTDLTQSRTIAKILSHDTADQTWERIVIAGANLDVSDGLQYRHNGDMPFQFFYSGIGIPCWSLAALLDVLPLEIETHKQTDGHKTYYYVELYMKRMEKDIYLSTERHENLVDACVEMILKLHELKLIIIYDEIGKYNIGDKLIFVKQ